MRWLCSPPSSNNGGDTVAVALGTEGWVKEEKWVKEEMDSVVVVAVAVMTMKGGSDGGVDGGWRWWLGKGG